MPKAEDAWATRALACKEIRTEVLAMFFAISEFEFYPFKPGRQARFWSCEIKLIYSRALHVLRKWLELLPQAAAKTIKMHIQLEPVDYAVQLDRAADWWEQTRELERSILHAVMDPANIFAMFRLEVARRSWGFVGPNCHQQAVLLCSGIHFDIPAADSNAAQEEVKRTLDAQSASIEHYVECAAENLQNDE
ncbi:hypothetical protein EJ03DRAFT_144733 [Teratosphaeria nubilosa]|uniref:Uncharacterized protein n=1 Tax=Teratosphaeria nubilosa TaxID=161662 RepID=A0A6G1L439_9PEZI|nr:hypothetical protein EJ03DRAFT_144733 [Teratosphaeria nubilosa]